MTDTVLVTGAAGFIGFHTSLALCKSGYKVIGYDNINDYYSPTLKRDRVAELGRQCGFSFEFIQADLADAPAVEAVFKKNNPRYVINLAAQAGVRYSLENPRAYIDSNLIGFFNLLEACRHYRIEHLVFASSSSVYGLNSKIPFSVHDNVDHPISLYAASKRSNELMAHSYSHLFAIPTTGLRFFTVYGPWGRPDMALFLFTEAILKGDPIPVFNNGKMRRDFTYIDDIVEGIIRVMKNVPSPVHNWSGNDPASSSAPFRIYNIGNNNPVELEGFISILEECLDKKAVRNYLPMQPGDVFASWADVDDLIRDTGYTPSTPVNVGIARFVEWYKKYYKK